MGRNSAANQKRYREKKKANDPEYAEKERARTRKRISRAVAKVNRKNVQLVLLHVRIQRRIWSLEKRLNRVLNKVRGNEKRNRKERGNTSTPVKQADALLRDAGITPRKGRSVRKTLILHNSLLNDLKTGSKANHKEAIKAAAKTLNSTTALQIVEYQSKGFTKKGRNKTQDENCNPTLAD